MNVRFSEQAVRCRITRAELDLLLVGRAIDLEVALPRDHTFRVNVRPGIVPAGSTHNGWKLDSDPTGLWLTIPRAQLEEFAQAPPSKKGLEQIFPAANGRTVTVAFEVDLRRS